MTRICLIGEADPFIALLLKRFAEENGLQAVIARAGQDLLAQARSARPAVIILEAELPGLQQGWEAVRAYRADRGARKVPVITCSWLDEAKAGALVDGAAAHLQKPELSYTDFKAALKRAGIDI
jgi:CheY-like chemotaxis protein